MNVIKFIYLTVVQLIRHAFSLPQTIINAIRDRKAQVILNEREVERLDRIRNPEKYRGKEI